MKIICTIGPKVSNFKDIEEYINSGMDMARFNFSHVDYIKFHKLISYIHTNHKDIKVMADLKGNKIRISKYCDKEFIVRRNDKVFLCLENNFHDRKKFISKDKVLIPLNYEGSINDFEKVKTIYMKDGTMKFNVENIDYTSKSICANVIKGGVIRKEKGVNAVNLYRKNNKLTLKDKKDIKWALEHNVKDICLSYVNKKEDVIEVKSYIKNINGLNNIHIWSKIECKEGIINFKEILNESYGIVLGRGDLRSEIPVWKIPSIQRKLMAITKMNNKPFIVATYILDSIKRDNSVSISELDDIYFFCKSKIFGLILSTELTISNDSDRIISYLNYLVKQYK